MFIRTERSIKEFVHYYPIVSGLVIINLSLWVMIDFLQLPLGNQLFQWGAGHNISIHNGEYWRLLTSVFLHGGLMHALFNSFALVLFGPALEQMIGKIKFIIAYVGAGLIGNLATYLIAPTAFYVHVGASGAVYGLLGMYIFMVVLRKHLIDPGSAQIVIIISIIGGIMTVLRPGINVYAHLFGFIGGFGLASLLLNNAQPFSIWQNRRVQNDDSIQFNPDRWKKKRIPKRIKSRILWGVLIILVILGLWSRLNP
ncbi:rhomboid family intramembrane serine protease [Virgibacillus alimentarius]|uniref:Membrane associated rhomboid family serine protease n=1 Tax=Virgibacillus alimentarius TaxID=698769 RepID=A0ABS4S9W6_9BACI|nr:MULTISPECIES: rhomboid family intramembrane serine protease [Virgibacillus]MBP2258306.1 membrane associated rhomboid family serine protease [Virgibacillus alimentarius]HLR67317.1 rhomboid family intramembrane serine protease [Virgibacillus sp.]